jgi:hypothetical protein
VKIDELIVQLARDAGPVRRLARPPVRLARWTAAALPMTAFAVIVIGPRPDVWTAIGQPAFAGLAVATLAMAVLAATGAFGLSVPGAERSRLHRVVPLVAGGMWALALVVLLATGGDPVRRMLALPVHRLCLIEIAGLSVVPGWALVTMLRRAAPLRRTWSGALATLAAAGLAALATQFMCPIDDPAHHLLGHLLPVALLSVCGAILGRRWLNWLGRAGG